MKRYEVYTGSEVTVEFDDLQEARHYARMNGGEVWDRQEWKTTYNYRVEGLDY
jgi:hypothetical protein